MKLLTAIIASAIVLVPSVVNAGQSMPSDREAAVETFCSYPTLPLKGALEDCIEVALEAAYRSGGDGIIIKRATDRFTSRVTGMGPLAVSAYTNGRILEFAAKYNNR